MKTSFCAAAGFLLGAGLVTPAVQATSLDTPVTAQEQITMFNPEDFAFALGGPEPSELVDNFQLRSVNLNQLPALEGQGISMTLVNLGPCAINLPHIHPRATEMLYTIEGRELRVAFVEENGGEGAVVNDLVAGDVAFFPQGLIHYQQNLDCYPATFLAALNSEDPGVVTITTRFFELPSEAIQASLNFDDPTLKKLIASLPEAPAMAQRQCLERCGLLKDDKRPEYDDDSYDSDDEKKRDSSDDYSDDDGSNDGSADGKDWYDESRDSRDRSDDGDDSYLSYSYYYESYDDDAMSIYRESDSGGYKL